MPYYMDRHELSGASAADVAAVHVKGLEFQDRYGVKYYWFDYEAQHAFCLATGPNHEAVEAVHAASHGLVSAAVRDLAAGKGFRLGTMRSFRLMGFDDSVRACDVVWQLSA